MSHRYTEFPDWDPKRSIKEVLPPRTKAFLCSYIEGASPDNIESHIKRIAKAGWDILQYPCFGMLWFLHFDLSRSPIYDEIIYRLQNSSIMLDLGCGLGQDIRRLVHDGVPGENIIGLDKSDEFIQLGFDLFQDRSTLKSTFLVEDFLRPSLKLEQLAGHIQVINSGYFLHLWNWDDQIRVAKRMIGLLSLQAGDLITGVHFGSDAPGMWEKVPADNNPIFLHNSSTFSEMWQQVEQDTGTKWLVWSVMEHEEDHAKLDPKGVRLRWFVKLQSRQS